MNGQFVIGSVVRKWEESHGDQTWYWVEHVRNGKTIYSYSNYADPLDSNANPVFFLEYDK